MAQQTMTLTQMMQAYRQITSDFNARRMDKAAYSAALTRLKAVDTENRWWSCTPEGGFVWYDGSRWVPGQPPIASALDGNSSASSAKAVPTAADGSQTNARKTNSSLKVWRKIVSTPILAILPGIVIGGIWFLYTLLRLIIGGTGGVDLLTPVILIGVPLLLWLLREPLDKLLMPLQKLQGSFPYPLRLGIALAVPMLFGCGCSAISASGYTAMHFTALISTLFGYFLLHKPAVKNIS
ncbi:MAG: hypothetical protein CL609_23510 [Anaerolineaceae bacterium]|nr:hypothetical protein [Anaerolineaceae bacterium]